MHNRPLWFPCCCQVASVRTHSSVMSRGNQPCCRNSTLKCATFVFSLLFTTPTTHRSTSRRCKTCVGSLRRWRWAKRCCRRRCQTCRTSTTASWILLNREWWCLHLDSVGVSPSPRTSVVLNVRPSPLSIASIPSFPMAVLIPLKAWNSWKRGWFDYADEAILSHFAKAWKYNSAIGIVCFSDLLWVLRAWVVFWARRTREKLQKSVALHLIRIFLSMSCVWVVRWEKPTFIVVTMYLIILNKAGVLKN